MVKYNVTVKTKNSPPIVICAYYMNDIVPQEKYLVICNNISKWVFVRSELEYYGIERIVYDEYEEERD